jgi:MFS family permease
METWRHLPRALMLSLSKHEGGHGANEDMPHTALTIAFLNLGHALDHLFMLIFPTVVLAMGAELGMPYAELLPLSLGGFIAFGAFSLPAGWLGDHWSRRAMMILFFVGIGAASVITGFARTTLEIGLGLTLIGVFAAIYHPVGIAMLVRNHPRQGQALGVNGFFGNLGVALAAIISGALADFVGWRWAFFVPGVLSVLAGLAFWAFVPTLEGKAAAVKKPMIPMSRAAMIRVVAVVLVTTVCGGIIFNATTVAMPKLFDQRLNDLVGTTFGIGTLVALVFLLAAFAQLLVGTLIDRMSLYRVFLPVAALQAPFLLLAGLASNYLMLATAIVMMFLVFGQIPINDAMVARYTNDEWRSRVYAVRYVVSFGASATAVPMIAYLYASTGDFRLQFTVLALIALCIFAAALMFPRPAAQAQPAVAE